MAPAGNSEKESFSLEDVKSITTLQHAINLVVIRPSFVPLGRFAFDAASGSSAMMVSRGRT
jgi:hypothetical protein